VVGGPFGATCVDRCFLNEFLPTRLGEAAYVALMSIGGPQEQHGSGSHTVLRRGNQYMLDQFLVLKHTFEGRPEDGQEPQVNWIRLPDILNVPNDTLNNIENNRLGITWYGNCLTNFSVPF
jgi:hypothetical protein